MAAESTAISSGPRFAPDDPSLEKPWKAVIDGTTGLLYYWNPETNVTQYERPASAPPPLPPGPSTLQPMPKLAPLPIARVQQANGTLSQPGQQMVQQSVYQVAQQQGQLLSTSRASQQLSYQQSGHPIIQQQGRQLLQVQSNQEMLMPHQHQQQYPNAQPQQLSQMPSSYPQAQHVASYMGHQPAALQMGHQQGQHLLGFNGADVSLQQAKPVGFSSLQFQPTGGVPSSSTVSSGGSMVQLPQMANNPSLSRHHTGGLSSVDGHQDPSPSLQSPSGFDGQRKQQMGSGSLISERAGPEAVHSQIPTGLSTALKMNYEESRNRRMSNDFSDANTRDSVMVHSHQPKLAAAFPPGHHQQDLRLGALPPHRGVVGHDRAGELNMAPGFGASNMYSHAFPDPTAPVGDPPRGSLRLPNSELSNLSAADLYRRQHEVTAVGDNVPAPFMSFEMTGFPPEILREM